MSSTCIHNTITDHSTGTEVCTICGLVLSENLYYDEIHSSAFKLQEEEPCNNYLIDDIDTILAFTQKIGDRLNLPDSSIENAILRFKKLRKLFPLLIYVIGKCVK